MNKLFEERSFEERGINWFMEDTMVLSPISGRDFLSVVDSMLTFKMCDK